MKAALKLIGWLAAVIAAGCVGLFFLFGGPRHLSLRRHFDQLLKTNDHRTVALAAVSLMRTATNQNLFSSSRLTNLPTDISRMKPQWVSVAPEQVCIEFHGGFDHFGFRIREADEDSWEMIWYTEKEQQHASETRQGWGAGRCESSAEIALLPA